MVLLSLLLSLVLSRRIAQPIVDTTTRRGVSEGRFYRHTASVSRDYAAQRTLTQAARDLHRVRRCSAS
jgi:hypothetical protein